MTIFFTIKLSLVKLLTQFFDRRIFGLNSYVKRCLVNLSLYLYCLL